MTASAVRETQKIRPTDPAPASRELDRALVRAERVLRVPDRGERDRERRRPSATSRWATSPDRAGKQLAGSSALVYREGFLDITTPSNPRARPDSGPIRSSPRSTTSTARRATPSLPRSPPGRRRPSGSSCTCPTGRRPGTYAGTATVTDSTGGATDPLRLDPGPRLLPALDVLARERLRLRLGRPLRRPLRRLRAPELRRRTSSRRSTPSTSRTRSTTASPSASWCTRRPSRTGRATSRRSTRCTARSSTAPRSRAQTSSQGAQITSIEYVGDQVSASYAAWATHAKANGWFDRVFDYTCDEPPERLRLDRHPHARRRSSTAAIPTSAR